jgi:hypothetical protein
MMKKDFGSIVKVAVCVLFAVSLCVVPGCKKSPQEPEPASPDQPTTGRTEPKPVSPQVAIQQAPEETEGSTGVTEVPVPDTSTSQEPETPKAPAADTAGFVPVEIKLPNAMFVGTPQDARVPNLEKPTGKARPPFLAPEGTKNVALDKPVASSDEEPIIGEIEMITDGDKEAADGSYVELGPFRQDVTVDLEAMHEIYAIVIWHYHKEARVYFDVVVQVADDPDFITNVKTLFNNDIDNSAGFGVGKEMHYTETNEGKLLDVLAKGIKARYVRLYSNGNTSNDLNHYIEVAVYGKPVE